MEGDYRIMTRLPYASTPEENQNHERPPR